MKAFEAEGALGPGPEEPTPAEAAAAVQAELEHHLACAAERLMEQGHVPEEARREAERRFGDVETIRRTCVHIQTRGNLMRKRLHVVVTAVLGVAVVYLFLSNRAAVQMARVEAQRAREVAQRHMSLLLEEQKRQREPVEHIVLGVGDEVELIDFYNPELRGSQRIAADGKILVPEVGWVHVAGLFREEAERVLTEALKPYFVQTEVKVRVEPPDDPR